MSIKISEDDIRRFEVDGAICLRQIFSPEWVTEVTNGIDAILRNPSNHGEFLSGKDGRGLYFNDYCNWHRIPEFKNFVYNSPVASVAAQLMRSSQSIFYHEHVLVKESGTDKKTPWHADMSYYPIDATQCLSVWMPVDPVELSATLNFISGSHRWPQWYMPRKFATSLNYPRVFHESEDGREWCDIPSDDELDKERVLGWTLDPGDCVVFHMKTIHGAAGNLTKYSRRILTTRWFGDDAVMTTRPWEVSPPVDGPIHTGQSPTYQGFPVIHTNV